MSNARPEFSSQTFCACYEEYNRAGWIDFSEAIGSMSALKWSAALIAYSQAWGCLSPAEYAVMGFILNRTIRFDKHIERIPQRHFLDGIYARDDGSMIQSPCCIGSHTTLEKAVVGLRAKGLIQVKKNKRVGDSYLVDEFVLRLGCLQCRGKMLPVKNGIRISDKYF